ncbi:MAG: ABC transporter ATP-binding protein [Verrucomicrobiota bacterium]
MHRIASVLRFGWPYLRRYWGRLASGIALGILFGLSNGAILGVSNLLLNRIFPGNGTLTRNVEQEPRKETTGFKADLIAMKDRMAARVNPVIDPWLPRSGRPIDQKQIVMLLLLLPGLFAFRGYIGYLSSYCMGWVSERVISDLRQDVFTKLSTLSMDFYTRSTMGDLITHVHGDTQALHRTLNLGVSDLVKEPITIISIFIGMLFIDWQLTIFFMLFMPLCVVPMAVLGKKARKASKGNVKSSVSQQSLLIEFLGSIRVVKAYSLEHQQTQRFAQHARQLVHHGMKALQAKEMVNPLIETIGALGLGVLIAYILYMNKSGADLAIFVGAVASVYTPIKKVAGLHVLFQQTSAGVDRLLKIIKEEPSVKEPVNPKPLPPFKHEVRFENIDFSYGAEPVLQNFSLTVPRGLKLGIAGESGSGKSTLVNLLFRFYDPTAGRITFDGVDIREVSMESLRSQMALVSQDIILFDQTVAENIACGKPGATRAEIEAAARAAYAHEFIVKLPDGYDTRVGDRGLTLSGGQRQRISIARAFIRQAPILALDEATAALDAQAEAEVQAAIDNIAEHRTVLAVAHRLSTLAKMDQIIVLKNGKIVESGTFQELIQRRGVFGEMAQKQAFAAV